MLEAVVLAFALAMDATAVATARGLSSGRHEAVILPLLFGAFQAGMAALGWLVGAWGGPYIVAWDHWVAFGLLVGIGTKMLFDAWRDAKRSDPDEPKRGGIALYLLLALATSIDAAAAGITLPLLAVAPIVAIILIGTITAACSALGFFIGRAVGGPKLALAGGLVLIGLGIRILVQHL